MDDETLDTIISRMPKRQAPAAHAGFAPGVMRGLGSRVRDETSLWPLACGLLAVAGALSWVDVPPACDPMSLSWAEILVLLPVGLAACLLFRTPRSQDTAQE